MSNSIEALVAELRDLGPRRFAGWNREAFDSYVDGPVASLTNQLEWRDKEQPDSDSIPNFLRMVFEAVGTGWVRVIQWEVPPPTFLAHCLSTMIPNGLGNIPRERRGDILRMAWNLGEGLAREPQWLNQYAITQSDWGTELEGLDRHLADVLAPVLSPLPPAKWAGRYRLHVLDLRAHSEEFVPGRLYLASPAVLCVENRVNPQETQAILLRKSGKSAVLGSVGTLPEHRESFEEPEIETTADAIAINGKSVHAAYISSPRQTLCVASGFVIVSADDSQRLWLVEAA